MTKAEKGQHDERLTCDEVVEKGLVEPELWAKVQEVVGRSVGDKRWLRKLD